MKYVYNTCSAYTYLVIHPMYIYTCHTVYGYKINLHRLYLCLPVCVHTYILIAETLKRGKGMGNGTEARTPKCLGNFGDERNSGKMLLRPYLCWVQMMLSVIYR